MELFLSSEGSNVCQLVILFCGCEMRIGKEESSVGCNEGKSREMSNDSNDINLAIP